MNKIYEIFRCGEHTDSNGKTKVWTEKDLDEMVSNFSENPDVPIAIGHIKGTSPAWGWFDNVGRIGKSLYCSLKQVAPEFEKWLAEGRYKTRSLAVDKNNVIKHLAFLGAKAPAVKGLEEYCFSEDEELYCFEFKEQTDIGISDEIDIQKELFNKNKEGSMDEQTKQELEAKDAKIAELEQKLQKQEDEKKDTEFSAFCESAVKEGHILPAQKNMVQSLLKACDSSEIQCFSENDEEKTAVQMFQEFIGSLKVPALDKEIANGDDADPKKEISEFSAHEIKDKILEVQNDYRKNGKEISVDEAIGILKKQ